MGHRQARRPTRTFAVAAAGHLRLRVVVAAELVVAAAEPVVKAGELAAVKEAAELEAVKPAVKAAEAMSSSTMVMFSLLF